MTVQTFYRGAVWLPLVVPALIALTVHGTGARSIPEPFQKPFQVLLISLVYGGVPYAGLAVWATWWIDARREAEIRARALRAPLYMVVAWMPFAALIGILSGRIVLFAGLLALGTAVIIPLGYAWVGLVLMLRAAVGRAGWIAAVT